MGMNSPNITSTSKWNWHQPTSNQNSKCAFEKNTWCRENPMENPVVKALFVTYYKKDKNTKNWKKDDKTLNFLKSH